MNDVLMETPMDQRTTSPILIDTNHIGHIWLRDDDAQVTVVCILSESGCYDHMIAIVETPDEVEKKIEETINVSGEDIRSNG